MSKEFDTIEINNEIIVNAPEQALTQLNELRLALVGGGSSTVAF